MLGTVWRSKLKKNQALASLTEYQISMHAKPAILLDNMHASKLAFITGARNSVLVRASLLARASKKLSKYLKYLACPFLSLLDCAPIPNPHPCFARHTASVLRCDFRK
jgi:hypothetical protein